MPVSELLRGLAGALGALLATLILTLCLAETRQRFGQTEWGVWWQPGKSWGRQFSPVWHPVLVQGAINMVVSYLLAGKLTTRRSVRFALMGAALAFVVAWLMGSPLPRLYGKAGQNTVWYCLLFFAFAGAYAGAAIAGKTPARRKKHRHGADFTSPDSSRCGRSSWRGRRR